MVYGLRGEGFAVGDILDTRHQGETKRPTEKRVEARDENEKKEYSERAKITAKNIHLKVFAQEIREKAKGDKSLLRKLAHNYRSSIKNPDPEEARIYLQPEDTKDVIAATAVYLALNGTNQEAIIPEEPHAYADLFVKQPKENTYRKVQVKIAEGSDVSIAKSKEGEGDFEIITVGENAFSAVTGEPNPDLKMKLEKVLQSN